jgi:hypothetical protein
VNGLSSSVAAFSRLLAPSVSGTQSNLITKTADFAQNALCEITNRLTRRISQALLMLGVQTAAIPSRSTII